MKANKAQLANLKRNKKHTLSQETKKWLDKWHDPNKPACFTPLHETIEHQTTTLNFSHKPIPTNKLIHLELSE